MPHGPFPVPWVSHLWFRGDATDFRVSKASSDNRADGVCVCVVIVTFPPPGNEFSSRKKTLSLARISHQSMRRHRRRVERCRGAIDPDGPALTTPIFPAMEGNVPLGGGNLDERRNMWVGRSSQQPHAGPRNKRDTTHRFQDRDCPKRKPKPCIRGHHVTDNTSSKKPKQVVGGNN